MRRLLLAAALAGVGVAACGEAPTTTVLEVEAPEEEIVEEEEVVATEGAQLHALPEEVAPRPLSAGETLLAASYGDGPGQLGGSGAPDASEGSGLPLGPPALAVSGDGEVFVLDGFRGRVLSLDGGETPLLQPPPIATGDLAATPDGGLWVLALAEETTLVRYGADGRALDPRAVGEVPEAPIGVAVGWSGEPYLLLAGGDAVGPGVAVDEEPLPGAPLAPDAYGLAQLLDDHTATVQLFDADGALYAEAVLSSVPALTSVSRVFVTGDGRHLVALGRAAIEPETGETLAEELLVVALDEALGWSGTAALPANDGRLGHRSVEIGPDGAVYQLHLGVDRATVLRWEVTP